MNENLSGISTRMVTNPAHTFFHGDGDSLESTGANYYKNQLPPDWRYIAERGQPPWFRRHLDGANYSFLDGHVKWLRPEQVSNESGKLYTFSTH